MRFDWGAVGREAIVASCFFLPRQERIRLERWLRGWQENRQIEAADFVIVSFPNSGRTWLHVLLLRYFQAQRGFEHAHFADLRALRDHDPAVPLIHFTHDNYLRDYNGEGPLKASYGRKKVVLLVRDPGDVAVSQFHQWQHRMRRRKKLINDYPLDPRLSLFEFTLGRQGVLARVIRFLNEWAEALPQMPEVLLVRYEDLRADTPATLAKILAFWGEQAVPSRIQEAVDYASLANMRALEGQGGRLFRPGSFSLWKFLRRGGAKNESALKARRAKVGGYRGDFSEYEAGLIDATIDRALAPVFGYRREASPVASTAASSKARMRAEMAATSAAAASAVAERAAGSGG
jgi:hypothetical protein